MSRDGTLKVRNSERRDPSVGVDSLIYLVFELFSSSSCRAVVADANANAHTMAITQPTKALTRLLWVALIIIIGGVSFFGWSSDYGVGDFALPSTLKETETAGYQEIGDVDLFVKGASPVSYDKTTPPGTGCEAIVAKSQSLLIEAYTKYFKGIRYVNLWGYLGEHQHCWASQTPSRIDISIGSGLTWI